MSTTMPSLNDLDFDDSCTSVDRSLIYNATVLAWAKITSCQKGLCGGGGNGKRKWLNSLVDAKISCPKSGSALLGDNANGLQKGTDFFLKKDGGSAQAITQIYFWSASTEISPGTIKTSYFEPECLASTIAHEAVHRAFSSSIVRESDLKSGFWQDLSELYVYSPFEPVHYLSPATNEMFAAESQGDSGLHTNGCFHCSIQHVTGKSGVFP